MSTSEAASHYPASDIPISVRETFTSQHHLRVLTSGAFSHDDLHFAFQILKQYVAYNTPNRPFVYVSLYQGFKAIAARARQLRTEYAVEIRFHAWGWSCRSAEEAAQRGHISEYNLDSAFEDIAHYLDVLRGDKGFQLYVAVMMHAILRCGEMLTCINNKLEVSNRMLEREAEYHSAGGLLEETGAGVSVPVPDVQATAEYRRTGLRGVAGKTIGDWGPRWHSCRVTWRDSMGEVATSVGATGDSWDANKDTLVDGTGRQLQKTEFDGGVAGDCSYQKSREAKSAGWSNAWGVHAGFRTNTP